MFAEYSNSYLVMSPGISDKLFCINKNTLMTGHLKYRICTETDDDADGRRIVRCPMTDAAAEHSSTCRKRQ